MTYFYVGDLTIFEIVQGFPDETTKREIHAIGDLEAHKIVIDFILVPTLPRLDVGTDARHDPATSCRERDLIDMSDTCREKRRKTY